MRLKRLKNQYLSKKGEVSLLMGELRNLSNEERPAFGQMVNQLKVDVEKALYDKKSVTRRRSFIRCVKERKKLMLPYRV